jgi:hypothetical protein
MYGLMRRNSYKIVVGKPLRTHSLEDMGVAK